MEGRGGPPAHPAAALTPYRAQVLADLARDVRAWLGVPGRAPLAIDDDGPRDADVLRLRIAVGERAAPIAVRLCDDHGAAALWSGGGWALALAGGGDHQRVIAHRLRQRLDGPLARRHLDEVVTPALERWRAVRRVPHGEWATLTPRELLLRLTFRCDQRCSFCWQDRAWVSPPTATMLGWIDEAASHGARALVLSGGEPTLHPDLTTFARRGLDRGMAVSLQTNAVRIGRQPDLARSLAAAGVGAAVISHHSDDARQSDALTGAPGTHALTERGILACLDASWQVTLNCVVEARNVASLPDHARSIVARFGGRAQDGQPLAVSYSHPNAAWSGDTRWPGLAATRGPLAAALAVLHQGGVVATAAGPCGFPLCALVGATGWIPRTSAGRPPGRTRAPACDRCALSGLCPGPRADFVAAFGDGDLEPFATVPADLGERLPDDPRAWWAG